MLINKERSGVAGQHKGIFRLLFYIMDELLKYAIENGIIDLSCVQEQIEMKKRDNLLREHPFKIWQGSDGYWNTYIPDDKKGRVRKKKKTEKEIQDIIIEYLLKEQENPSIKDVFEEWIERKLSLRKISNSTYDRYKRLFDRHFEDFGEKKIKRLEEDDFCDFLESEIVRCNLTAKGFGNLKSLTKGFLIRAKKRKLIDWNVSNMMEELDVSDKDFKKVIKEDYEEVFNDDEMKLIIEYLLNNLDIHNVGILLIFVTGIRCGELVGLKHSDFDDYSFKIRRTETRYKGDDGKDRYEIKNYPKTAAGVRTCIIPNDYWWLIENIKQLNQGEEYIFMKNGKRMTTNTIRDRLWRICEKIDIFKKSPHKARKTYISILLDNKVDNNLITSLVGHTDISCSENHYHRNRKKLSQKADIISIIPEFRMSQVKNA